MACMHINGLDLRATGLRYLAPVGLLLASVPPANAQIPTDDCLKVGVTAAAIFRTRPAMISMTRPATGLGTTRTQPLRFSK